MVELEHVQQENNGECGLACLGMIFKYYKIPYKKDDMWNSIKSIRPDNHGEFAWTHSLAEYAIRHGLNATVYEANDDTCFGVLDRLGQLNIPAILSVRYKNTDYAHFICYKGKEDEYYLFNDPDLDKNRNPVRYDYHEVRELWSPHGKEVAGFEYIVFCGDPLPKACMYCGRRYPILTHYKIPLSNKIPFSNKTVCPYCNRVNDI